MLHPDHTTCPSRLDIESAAFETRRRTALWLRPIGCLGVGPVEAVFVEGHGLYFFSEEVTFPADLSKTYECAGSRLLRNAARLPVTCRRECKRAAYHRGMCDCLIHPDEDMLIEHQGAAAKHHAGNHDCLQHSDLDLANECGCCPHGVQASIDAHVGKTA